jgi:hypothetical protein
MGRLARSGAIWRRRRGARDGVHALAENGVLHLPRGSGAAVRVESGRIVVTRAGDPEDHVLEAGGELALDVPGLALAWALAPSVLAVRSASPAAGRRQIRPIAALTAR